MDMMAIRRRVLMAQKKKRLPSEYQEVGYIISNDGARIDTDISIGAAEENFTNPFVLDLDCVAESFMTGTTNIIASFTENGSAATWYGIISSLQLTVGGGINSTALLSNRKVVRMEYYGKSCNVIIDGETIMRTRTMYPISKLMLFGTSSYKSNIRCYSAILYHGDDKLAEFIPCYRKSDGEIGLYDIVRGRFFTNANTTGTFTKGANV